jgi:hypothetical protein
MNRSQRIELNNDNINNDKYLKVRLEENVDTIEFLSMNINTTDVYQNFNADYGVLVGRVIANGGVGIPNAKISVFIPLTDEDAQNGQIYSIYPYKTPRDKNAEGKRYNLLPRVGKIDPATGQSSPKQPFGSFPIKEEVIANQKFLTVYKKYYKHTAITNNSGDYMIFGVPIGTQTIHMSVDITDIGEYSMTPASMVTNLGYSPNLFMENNTKIKPSTDLNDLPHIETQEVTVDIIPFWGDKENFEIGITKQNFRIRSTLVNTFIIFGSAFTDGDGSMFGDDFAGGDPRIRELFRARTDANNTIGIYSKRIGKITEKVYYYPTNVSDSEINAGADPRTKMLLLDPSEYSVYKRDGDFVFIINCNRGKVVTDDFGNKVPVDDSSTSGIFTKFRGFVTLEFTVDDIPMNWTGTLGQNSVVRPIRYKLKFPQYANQDQSFTALFTENDSVFSDQWRKQHYTFEAGKFYSISRFHGLSFNHQDDDNEQNLTVGFYKGSIVNDGVDDPFWNVGIIATDTYSDYNNADYQFPSNITNNAYVTKLFGANWLNLSVYLPQIGYIDQGYSNVRYVRTSDNFTKQNPGNTTFNGYFTIDNLQEIAAGDYNTKWFARSDLHWTDFIEVPVSDIINMRKLSKRGFTNEDLLNITLNNYHGGSNKPSTWPQANSPINGGKVNGNYVSSSYDPYVYFYKGWGASDCVEYLYLLGILT